MSAPRTVDRSRLAISLCFALLLLGAPAALGQQAPAAPQTASVEWEAPEDGGTPRDLKRVERVGPNEFRRASRSFRVASCAARRRAGTG